MNKIFIAAALSVLLVTPALADDEAKCDEATMKLVNGQIAKLNIMKMRDQPIKIKASREMALARDAVKAKKLDECADHIETAKKILMK